MKKLLLFLSTFLLLGSLTSAEEGTRLLHEPDISADKVVFMAMNAFSLPIGKIPSDMACRAFLRSVRSCKFKPCIECMIKVMIVPTISLMAGFTILGQVHGLVIRNLR